MSDLREQVEEILPCEYPVYENDLTHYCTDLPLREFGTCEPCATRSQILSLLDSTEPEIDETAPEYHWTTSDWVRWTYDVGLKLDGVVRLSGLTNRQRIEAAVDMLVSEAEEPEITTGRDEAIRQINGDFDEPETLTGMEPGSGATHVRGYRWTPSEPTEAEEWSVVYEGPDRRLPRQITTRPFALREAGRIAETFDGIYGAGTCRVVRTPTESREGEDGR